MRECKDWQNLKNTPPKGEKKRDRETDDEQLEKQQIDIFQKSKKTTRTPIKNNAEVMKVEKLSKMLKVTEDF